jgi:hypothetical protein
MLYVIVITAISTHIVLKYMHVSNYKQIIFFVTLFVVFFFMPKD